MLIDRKVEAKPNTKLAAKASNPYKTMITPAQGDFIIADVLQKALVGRIYESVDAISPEASCPRKEKIKFEYMERILSMQKVYIKACAGEYQQGERYFKKEGEKYKLECRALNDSKSESGFMQSQIDWAAGTFGQRELRKELHTKLVTEVMAELENECIMTITVAKEADELFDEWKERWDRNSTGYQKWMDKLAKKAEEIALTIKEQKKIQEDAQGFEALLDLLDTPIKIHASKLRGNQNLHKFLTRSDQVKKIDVIGYTSLHIACYIGDLELAKNLINTFKVKIDYSGNNTPLKIILRDRHSNTQDFLNLFKLSDDQIINHLELAVSDKNSMATDWMLQRILHSSWIEGMRKRQYHQREPHDLDRLAKIKKSFLAACQSGQEKIVKQFIEMTRGNGGFLSFLTTYDLRDGLENALIHGQVHLIEMFYNESIFLDNQGKLKLSQQSPETLAKYLESIAQLSLKDSQQIVGRVSKVDHAKQSSVREANALFRPVMLVPQLPMSSATCELVRPKAVSSNSSLSLA